MKLATFTWKIKRHLRRQPALWLVPVVLLLGLCLYVLILLLRVLFLSSGVWFWLLLGIGIGIAIRSLWPAHNARSPFRRTSRH